MVAEREWSKNDLVKEFAISSNTVVETLKACGLSTTQRKYNAAEVDRFRIARKLLGGGATYDEVRVHFGLKDATHESDEYDSHSSGPPQPQGTQFIDDITQEIESSIQAIITAGVEDLINYIPAMAANALEDAARKGLIREAFAKYRQAYVTGRKPFFIEHSIESLDDTESDFTELQDAEEPPEEAQDFSDADESDSSSPM